MVLALAVILAAAKIGGDLAERLGQPAVLGELLAGVMLGNLDLGGLGWFHAIETDAAVSILASLGVIIRPLARHARFRTLRSAAWNAEL